MLLYTCSLYSIISELQSVYDREVNFGQWENSDFPHYLESTGTQRCYPTSLSVMLIMTCSFFWFV